MTTTQLPLVRPGYCRICTCVRLSVANTSGVCDGCSDELARVKKDGRGVLGRKSCIRCGGWPVVYRSKCAECNRADTRAYREQARLKYHEKAATVTGAELAPQTLERCA